MLKVLRFVILVTTYVQCSVNGWDVEISWLFTLYLTFHWAHNLSDLRTRNIHGHKSTINNKRECPQPQKPGVSCGVDEWFPGEDQTQYMNNTCQRGLRWQLVGADDAAPTNLPSNCCRNNFFSFSTWLLLVLLQGLFCVFPHMSCLRLVTVIFFTNAYVHGNTLLQAHCNKNTSSWVISPSTSSKKGLSFSGIHCCRMVFYSHPGPGPRRLHSSPDLSMWRVENTFNLLWQLHVSTSDRALHTINKNPNIRWYYKSILFAAVYFLTRFIFTVFITLFQVKQIINVSCFAVTVAFIKLNLTCCLLHLHLT